MSLSQRYYSLLCASRLRADEHHSVYVQNLEERMKLDPLTKALRVIFSEFGTVVDIVAKKNLRARGQAFVVFDSVNDAINSIDEMQGFELFGKPMRLSMSRTKSDQTVSTKCTNDEYAAHRKHRQAEKEKRMAREAACRHPNLKRVATGGPEYRPVKLAKSSLKAAGAAGSTVIPDEYLPPNKILFLQNVSDEIDVDALTTLFVRFEGFREIRLVPGRRGIAFVEYETEQGAITAKENVAGMTLGDKSIKVTYQRQ